jgi:hypothetical protein
VNSAPFSANLSGRLIAEIIPGLGYRRGYHYLHDIPIGVVWLTD